MNCCRGHSDESNISPVNLVFLLHLTTLLSYRICIGSNSFFIHSSVVLQPFVGPWPLLQFRNLFHIDGRTPWTRNQPVARPLPTHKTTQTQNKHTHQTSMPCMEFERTIPASERRQYMLGYCDRRCII
jgi:hypothetical protein